MLWFDDRAITTACYTFRGMNLSPALDFKLFPVDAAVNGYLAMQTG